MAMNVPGNDPPHVDAGGIMVLPPVVVAPPVEVLPPVVVVVPVAVVSPVLPVVTVVPPAVPDVVGCEPAGRRPELVGSTSPHPSRTVSSAIQRMLAANVNTAVRCRAATIRASLVRWPHGLGVRAWPSVEGPL